MSEQLFSIRFRNFRKQGTKVYFEPWGGVYVPEPDKMLQLETTGPIGAAPNDVLEIHSGLDLLDRWAVRLSSTL